MKRTHAAFALALLLPLAACSPSAPENSPSGNAGNAPRAATDTNNKSSESFVSGEMRKAMQEATQDLATENIGVNDIHVDTIHIGHNGGHRHDDQDSLPKAEITPQGALLIAGNQVPATPAQQALLLNYRQQIVGIAETGMDIGTQGADLGIRAAKTAVWGALSGKSDKDIDAAIKPQTDKIQAAAIKLCQRLPELLSSQQKLAAAMPAFKPYATMRQEDVDNCGKDEDD